MEFSVNVEGIDRIDRKSKELVLALSLELAKGMYASAKKVEAEAKQSIAQGSKTGRIYNRRSSGKMIGSAVDFKDGGAVRQGGFRSGYHRASAPGESPASDTGRLINSINGTVVDRGLTAVIRAGGGMVNYARSLEFGTRKMAARPFMFPAFERSKQFIADRLKQAVQAAINSVAR
ncbi:HK97-gp10 family putative phage morphogenesis protein [Zavarzinella formosa]|uniref:hypothetical protein n=1 Tax=Zavarzinella formosa TaxID=360055 RepID=UPI0002DDD1DD|nr:hypothetical protein [Zavarzinella formosa]